MSSDTVSVSDAVTVRLACTWAQAPSWSGGGSAPRSPISTKGSGRPGSVPLSVNSASVSTISASHGRSRPVAGSTTSGLYRHGKSSS